MRAIPTQKKQDRRGIMRKAWKWIEKHIYKMWVASIILFLLGFLQWVVVLILTCLEILH